VELKGIMRSALLGLRDVHERGLVYAGTFTCSIHLK
jgi:hypothetical protein